jgi:geranylgeranyl pyrophosphate synthase
MDAAVAIELTHTASLVLDDLPCMDDTALRRGQMATHRVVGSAGAILVAVGLLGRAAELLGTSRAGGILAAEWGLTIGLEGMSGGQAVDVAHAGSGAARAAARRLHRRKTTALSAFALLAGAQSVGARPAVAGALARFGRDLGWAYQLADDAEDLSEDHSAGRAPGGRSPRRQSDFILARAQRQLTRAAVVPPGGTRLLTALAEAVVRGSQQGRVLAR